MGQLHLHFLDSYAHIDSPLRRLPAGAKVLFAVLLVIATVTVPASPVFLVCVALLLIFLASLSNVPWLFIVKRLLFLEPFVIGVAILSLFQPHGIPTFALLVTRSTLCLLTMILLANTTPFSDLMAVLKRLHVPALLVTTIALMHRYLFVLVEESERMRRARASRTFRRGAGPSWETLATVIGQLFARSSDRAERIYVAMCARGWKS